MFHKNTNNTGLNETKTSEKILAVNKMRCPQNHPCPSIPVCPVGALKQTGYSAPVVDQEKCIRCGKCVSFCPMRALALQ
jgi:ferredoxin